MRDSDGLQRGGRAACLADSSRSWELILTDASPEDAGSRAAGAFYIFGCWCAVDWISAIETIVNWSLSICHLSSKHLRYDAPATLRAFVALCGPHRHGGGRAAGDPVWAGDVLERGLAITDDKFSMTNAQLKGPKS